MLTLTRMRVEARYKIAKKSGPMSDCDGVQKEQCQKMPRLHKGRCLKEQRTKMLRLRRKDGVYKEQWRKMSRLPKQEALESSRIDRDAGIVRTRTPGIIFMIRPRPAIGKNNKIIKSQSS